MGTLKISTKKAIFHNGKQISPYIYDNTYESLNYNTILAEAPGFFVFYDKNTGEKLSRHKGEILKFCNNSFFKVQATNSKLIGLYSFSGKLILPIEFDDIYLDYEEVIIVKHNNLYGAFTYDGKQILPVIYDQITVWISKFILVYSDSYVGLYDFSGNCLIPIKYNLILCFDDDENLGFEVMKDDLYGLVSKDYNEIIPTEFKHIYNFNNFVEVNKNDSWGVYDYNGKVIVPSIYAWTMEYNNEHKYIRVHTHDGKSGCYSFDGNIIIPPEFSDFNITNTVIEVKKTKDSPWEIYKALV